MSRVGHAEQPMQAAGHVGERSQLDLALLKVVDGGLAGCIFVVPLLMGGRQALGQLLLVTLAVAVAVAWMAPRTAEILPLWNPQANPSIALGTWSCVSLTPTMTQAALTVFLAYCLLFLVTVQRIRTLEDVQRLLRWIALAAVMMAIFGLVQLLTSNGKFFWFYEHPFSETSDGAKGSFTNRNHFAHFLALGIGPLVWWLQENIGRRRRHRRTATSRLNKDLQTETNLSGFRTLAFGVVLFAGLLSLSRGGVLVMFVAAAIAVAVCFRAKRLKPRFVMGLAGVAVLIGVLLAVHGLEQVSDRMGQLSSGSVEQLDAGAARRTIWAAVGKAVPDFALLGSGVGSHRYVYPMYLEGSVEGEFTHAENGPLQVLLESGTVGLTLLVAGIGFCGFWCVATLARVWNLPRSGQRSYYSSRVLVCAGAVSASLAISVLHSLVDFVWYVPACTALVAVLAGCACRLWQLAGVSAGKQSRPIALPTPVAVVAVLLLLTAGTWMIGNRIGPTLAESHWDRYRILKLASENPTAAEQQQLADASPDQVYETSLEAINRMIVELEQVVRCDPLNAKAHLDLVAAYLSRFNHTQQRAENAMSLTDLRDAAAQAHLAAKDEEQHREVRQWLARTIGRQGGDLHAALKHAQQGLALCPLRGEAYLYLSQLRFLEGSDTEAIRDAYLDQALRVRPREGNVLFEAGRAAIDRAICMLSGLADAPPDSAARASFQQEFARGLAYWRQSFQAGRAHQKRLIEALAGRVPAAYFVESFQPDLGAMRMLRAAYCWLAKPENSGRVYQLYSDRCRAEGRRVESAEAAAVWLERELAQLHFDYARIAHHQAKSLQGAAAAETWVEAALFYRLTDDHQQALECAKEAYRFDPDDYQVRYSLALSLIDQELFEEAEDHLHWCSRKRPDNEKLRWLLEATTKNRISKQVESLSQGEKPRTLR